MKRWVAETVFQKSYLLEKRFSHRLWRIFQCPRCPRQVVNFHRERLVRLAVPRFFSPDFM